MIQNQDDWVQFRFGDRNLVNQRDDASKWNANKKHHNIYIYLTSSKNVSFEQNFKTHLHSYFQLGSPLAQMRSAKTTLPNKWEIMCDWISRK